MGSLFGSSEAPSLSEIRAARITSARRNHVWTELEESALARRERWLVDADSDATFLPYRGTVFTTGQAAIAASDYAPLFFYVDQDSDIVFLEKQRQSWSEVYARQVRREAARS